MGIADDGSSHLSADDESSFATIRLRKLENTFFLKFKIEFIDKKEKRFTLLFPGPVSFLTQLVNLGT